MDLQEISFLFIYKDNNPNIRWFVWNLIENVKY